MKKTLKMSVSLVLLAVVGLCTSCSSSPDAEDCNSGKTSAESLAASLVKTIIDDDRKAATSLIWGKDPVIHDASWADARRVFKGHEPDDFKYVIEHASNSYAISVYSKSGEGVGFFHAFKGEDMRCFAAEFGEVPGPEATGDPYDGPRGLHTFW